MGFVVVGTAVVSFETPHTNEKVEAHVHEHLPSCREELGLCWQTSSYYFNMYFNHLPQVVPPLPYLNEYALRNLYGNVIQEEGGVGGWKPLLWNAKAERTH